jgi:acyl-coenzyme A synthetase/AMP-(fatty) acid ligase
MPIDVLTERGAPNDFIAFQNAWAQDRTFAYIAQAASVDRSWLDEAIATIPSEFHSGHCAILTSGSTGLPKLIIGEKARSERLAETLHVLQHNEQAEDTILALPLSYSFAFVNQCVWATIMNRPAIPTGGFADLQEFETTLKAAKASMLCLVGVQATLLVDAFGDRTYHGITNLHFAGGRFPQSLIPSLRQMFPNAYITNNYGCAEAMPRLALREATEKHEGANVGWALPGIEMRSDDESRILFRSQYGAVAIVESANLSRFDSDTWIPSGDHGVREADESWLLHGRANEVFKRHGEKVSIPSILETVTGVWHGEATTYQDLDRAGESGYVLVLAPAPPRPKLRELLEQLRTRHPRAQWPLRIEACESLPRLANGKIATAEIATLPNLERQWDQRI